MSNPIIIFDPALNPDYALLHTVCPGADKSGRSVENPELTNFRALIQDANNLSSSRKQMQLDSAKWTAISRQISALVQLSINLGNNKFTADTKSKIYGQIMLIITAEYLPTISDFLGDQIAEQASIENIASDVSAFIIDTQTGFNNLAGCPDETQCTDNFKLYSGMMALATGTNSSSSAFNEIGELYSFTITTLDPITGKTTEHAESNILAFLTDTSIWGSTTPLTTSEVSQINTGLTTIATIFNSGNDTTLVNSWNEQNFQAIDTSIVLWTAPYPANHGGGCSSCGNCSSNPSGCLSGGCCSSTPCTSGCSSSQTSSGQCCNNACSEVSSTDCFCSNNAPLVYTDPNQIQEGINQASQAVETVATSTQTVENFQIQEIDQFYGITNSIQQSQEQQCAAMVKQQTA